MAQRAFYDLSAGNPARPRSSVILFVIDGRRMWAERGTAFGGADGGATSARIGLCVGRRDYSGADSVGDVCFCFGPESREEEAKTLERKREGPLS